MAQILIGLVIGLLLGSIGTRIFLYENIKNNVLYKPGTGKIFKHNTSVLLPFEKKVLKTVFLEKKINHKFFRFAGRQTMYIMGGITKPTYIYKVEYWD